MTATRINLSLSATSTHPLTDVTAEITFLLDVEVVTRTRRTSTSSEEHKGMV